MKSWSDIGKTNVVQEKKEMKSWSDIGKTNVVQVKRR